MEQVTIVLTVYNKAPWLDRTFNALMNQTYKNIEILVIDNASTDDSPVIIKRYAEMDNRIRVIRIDKNIGPSNGFATGYRNATGYYVGSIDADDIIELNYVEALYHAIDDEKADMAMCVNDRVWDDGYSDHKPWPKDNKNIVDGESAKYLPLQLLDELNTKYFGFYFPELGVEWGKLYRTDLLREYNLEYDKDLWIWCDHVFNLEVVKHVNKLVYIKDTTYHFYQDNESVTRLKGYSTRLMEHSEAALTKMYDASKDIELDEIEAALNVFRYRLLWNAYYYAITYWPGTIKFKDVIGVLNHMNSHQEIQKLYNSTELQLLDDKKIKYLRMFRDKKHILALSLYLNARRITANILRRIGIKKTR